MHSGILNIFRFYILYIARGRIVGLEVMLNHSKHDHKYIQVTLVVLYSHVKYNNESHESHCRLRQSEMYVQNPAGIHQVD